MTRAAMVFRVMAPVPIPGSAGWRRLSSDVFALRLWVESWRARPAGPLDVDVFHVGIWVNGVGSDVGARESAY